MRLRWSITAAIVLLTAACTRESVPSVREGELSPEGGLAIRFGVQQPVKAPGEMGLAQLRAAHFGVFACHTGSTPYNLSSVVSDFMYNQEISYSASAWTYSPVKYWPGEEDYISFFAYAPYEAAPAEGKCIMGFSPREQLGDPWLIYALAGDVASQVDLLYGVNALTGKSWTDVRRPSGAASTLDFTFRHALSTVGDNIIVKGSSALMTELASRGAYLTINSVTVVYSNLTAKGRLILNTRGGPNWEPVYSGELTVSRTVSITSLSHVLTGSPYTLASDRGVFYIPMHIPSKPAQSATITVAYTLSDGVAPDASGSASASFNLPETAGETRDLSITLTEDIDVLH